MTEFLSVTTGASIAPHEAIVDLLPDPKAIYTVVSEDRFVTWNVAKERFDESVTYHYIVSGISWPDGLMDRTDTAQ